MVVTLGVLVVDGDCDTLRVSVAVVLGVWVSVEVLVSLGVPLKLGLAV